MANISPSFVNEQQEAGEYPDDKLKGFLLRVSASGVKSYIVRARIKGGANLSYTIGKHASPWTATTARKEAEQILAIMKLGIDPREEAKNRKAQAEAKESEERVNELKTELTLRKGFEQWRSTDRKTKE